MAMDVYVIPVGPNRYEMYCEDADDAEASIGDVQPTGRFAGIFQKFKVALARVEEERKSGVPADRGPRTWTERLKDRAMCWIAEKVAEQRLLWRIRNEAAASLFFPDDLSTEDALKIARADFQREADRHLKWAIIDGALFAVLGPALFLVPGPNVVAYYFGFRMVGHYLSMRGARHAVSEVQWQACPSAHLCRLRGAVDLGGEERDREVHHVAAELRLLHLSKFFERIATRPA